MSEQTPTPEMPDTEAPSARFHWDTPLLRLAPGESYIPPTIEELRAGGTGWIIRKVTSADSSTASDAKGTPSTTQGSHRSARRAVRCRSH